MKFEEMVEEQLKKEKAIEEKKISKLPANYILYDVKVTLVKAVVTILEEKSHKMIALHLIDLELAGKLGVKFQIFSVYLNDIVVNQYKVDNSLFEKIVETYEDDFIDRRKSEIALGKQTNKGRKGAFYIEFENNPDMEKSDKRVLLRNEKRLYITANAYALNYTLSKVSSATSSEVDYEEMEKNAREEMIKMVNDGREYANALFEGDFNHNNIEIDILFKGPKIIIPQNVLDKQNRSCLLFNFG